MPARWLFGGLESHLKVAPGASLADAMTRARLYPAEPSTMDSRREMVCDFLAPCIDGLANGEILWKGPFGGEDGPGSARLDVARYIWRGKDDAVRRLKKAARPELTPEAREAFLAVPKMSAWVASPRDATRSILDAMRARGAEPERRQRERWEGGVFVAAETSGLVIEVELERTDPVTFVGAELSIPGSDMAWHVPEDAWPNLYYAICQLPTAK